MEEGLPLVSLVVLNWNGEKCLESCLRSIFKQDYPNYEVIVVDNASTDASPRLIEEKFPKARLIRNKANLGFAKGVNIGIKVAKGPIVAVLNNDVVLPQGWLSALVREMLKSPEVGIVSNAIYYHERGDVLWALGGKLDAFTGMCWHVGEGQRLAPDSHIKLDDLDYVPWCAVLVRKELFRKLGPLDENFFIYWEDVDFCLRARRAGYRVLVVPHVPTWHLVSFSAKKMLAFSYYHVMKGAFYLFLKHFPLRHVISAFFSHLVLLTLLELFVLRYPAYYAWLKLKGLLWTLRHLKHALAERRKMSMSSKGKGALKTRLLEVLERLRDVLRRATHDKTPF